MLTAAVRDLHRSCPNEFITDIRSPCPGLWENNPFVTPISDNDSDARKLECHYPLIHNCNEAPFHFIHGFHQFLGTKLKKTIVPSQFKGDIYVSEVEKGWYSQVYEIVGVDIPFWIIVAGGKYDYTIKWWDSNRFQDVVDHFKGKILFVQVGETKNHFHPPLEGVIDLRGKTDLRQLVRLVYHSSGVLCPVTLMMHLAAAVETKPNSPPLRPCVVVAGGREPPHWEAYPHHQFLHTVGALPCCEKGGCWKSRTIPIGDGDGKDLPKNLCVDVVDELPRCMDMIRSEQVIRAIELYYEGKALKYLTPSKWKKVVPHLQKTPVAAT